MYAEGGTRRVQVIRLRMGNFVDMKYCIVMARIENRLEVRNTLSKQLYEVEAINILNGNHISEYIQKYSMMKEDVPFNHTHKKGENLFNLELLDQLDRLVLLLRDDYNIPDED